MNAIGDPLRVPHDGIGPHADEPAIPLEDTTADHDPLDVLRLPIEHNLADDVEGRREVHGAGSITIAWAFFGRREPDPVVHVGSDGRP